MQRDTRMYRRPWISWPRRFLVAGGDGRIYSGHLGWIGSPDCGEPAPHAYEEDDLFSTAVIMSQAPRRDWGDHRDQIRKQQYFLNRFSIIWLISWWRMCKNCFQQTRHIRCTSRRSQSMVCDLNWSAITGKERGHINKYWLTNSRSGKQLKAPIIKMASIKSCRLPFRARQV